MSRLPDAQWLIALWMLPALGLPLAACADGTPQRAAPAARPAAASVTPGLCTAAEVTLFDCATARGKRIAICAAGTPGSADARAQYRFGRAGQVELAYPNDAATGPQQLLASHYGRAGVDRVSIRFETNAAEYVVYDWREEGEQRRSGVNVTLKRKPAATETRLACTGPVTIDPPAVAARLRCDQDSELPMPTCR